mmetsp:Transcript_30453/g.99349  ORF Transcript_30453/g.99349 Transcript_30453/m.99349 type:complete len:83 (+) Transcript_30453:317-565(+)
MMAWLRDDPRFPRSPTSGEAEVREIESGEIESGESGDPCARHNVLARRISPNLVQPRRASKVLPRDLAPLLLEDRAESLHLL